MRTSARFRFVAGFLVTAILLSACSKPNLEDMARQRLRTPSGAPRTGQHSAPLPLLKPSVTRTAARPTPPRAVTMEVMQAQADVVASLVKIPAATRNSPGFYQDLMATSTVNAKSAYPRTEIGFLSYLHALDDVQTFGNIKALLDARASPALAPASAGEGIHEHLPTPSPAPGGLPSLQAPVTPVPGQTPPPLPKL